VDEVFFKVVWSLKIDDSYLKKIPKNNPTTISHPQKKKSSQREEKNLKLEQTQQRTHKNMRTCHPVIKIDLFFAFFLSVSFEEIFCSHHQRQLFSLSGVCLFLLCVIVEQCGKVNGVVCGELRWCFFVRNFRVRFLYFDVRVIEP
jgi:hypothetical protein